MKLSQRIQEMQASPIRKLVPLAQAAEKTGKKVYHLNIGQPDIKTPPAFFEAIQAFDKEVLAYANSQGWMPLIESICTYFSRLGISYDPADIVITNGGSEALQFVFAAICNPGDELLVPEPFYTNYRGFSLPFGVELKPITTRAEESFALPSKKEIESLITPRTRGILISNPGNPTGAVYTKEELQRLVDLALAHDLFLVGDEVYREFTYGDQQAISLGSFEEVRDRVILVDSVSKRFSACGARIGCFISANQELIQGVMKIAQSRLCVPTLEMVGAKALYDLPADFFAPVAEEYKHRRDVMIDGLQAIPGVLCHRPAGAFYAIAKMPVDNAETFVRWMLNEFSYEDATVMLAPVENFYSTPGMGVDEARLAYVLNATDLQKAIEILGRGLAAYPGRKA